MRTDPVWIKFCDQKPPSYKEIVYEYKMFEGKDKITSQNYVSIGWVESASEEELMIWDIRHFTIYGDDEDYELINWFEVPK